MFQPERGREPAVRPDRDSWPVVTAELRTFPSFPAMSEAWRHWREYVFHSDTPLTPRDLLHTISVVALQNAESRLAMGRALTTG